MALVDGIRYTLLIAEHASDFHPILRQLVRLVSVWLLHYISFLNHEFNIR